MLNTVHGRRPQPLVETGKQLYVLQKLDRLGRWLEQAVLFLLLGTLILLAATQIFMRNVLDSGMIWADEFLRITVLWLTLAGAVAASRENKHISIDILGRFLSTRIKLFTQLVVNMFTSAICLLLAWFSYSFVRDSLEYGDTVMGDMPGWIFQIVLPVGFSLIAYRYFVFALSGLRDIGGGVGKT